MQWMMSTITNVDSYFTKLSLENRMTSLSLHVISWFIKISNPWNMTFFLFAKDISMIIDHYSWIMEGLFILLSL